MKFALRIAAALVFVATSVSQSSALTITAGTTSAVLLGQSGQTGNNEILGLVADFLGYVPAELYKQNYNGSEEGDADIKASYSTSFSSITSGDGPSTATITYAGTGNYIASSVSPIRNVYGLVKDGNNVPTFYLYNLTALGWNGTDQLVFTNFWANTQGAISHVSLFGTEKVPTTTGGGGDPAPDGGSMAMLLGMSLMGIAGARRYMR